jgi:protein-tyrosine phosphatase
MPTIDSSNYLRDLKSLDRLRLHLVCLGNICRSPMANAVLANKTSDIKKPRVIVDSSGTGPWHVGEGATDLSQQVWQMAGYKYSHTAKQFNKSFFEKHDLILTMDLSNRESILKMAESDQDLAKVFMFRSFDPELSEIDPEGSDAHLLSVPDPYGKPIAEYQKVLAMVERAADGINLWVRS